MFSRTPNFLLTAVACCCLVTAPVMADEHSHKHADIVDTAVQAGSFKTLAAALQAANLVDALKGKGPFTVFAPTDDAFAKFPPGVVPSLLRLIESGLPPGRYVAAQIEALAA